MRRGCAPPRPKPENRKENTRGRNREARSSGPSLRRGTRHATFPDMKKPADGLTVLLPLLAFLLVRSPRVRGAETASRMPYPPSRTADVTDVLHGVPVPDPYRWLEDEKSPEVRAWMKAQDDLTRQRLASLAGRDAIASRLKELFYLDAVSAPKHRGSRFFFTRRHS